MKPPWYQTFVIPVNLANTKPAAAIAVPMFDVNATAGGGRMEHDAGANGALAFPAPLLRRITASPADGLRLITMSGDSMTPTLEHGDMVMVDTNRTSPLASRHFRP